MRNMIMFGTVLLTVAVSLCIGVPRYSSAIKSNPPVMLLDDSSLFGVSSKPSAHEQTQMPPPPPPPPQPAAIPNVPHIGSVQVLNGCGMEGAANRMADFLRLKKFDVKDIGNAPSYNHPATMVISRTADMGLANEVEKFLKTGKVVLIRNNEQLYDVTVVAGPDFEERIK